MKGTGMGLGERDRERGGWGASIVTKFHFIQNI